MKQNLLVRRVTAHISAILEGTLHVTIFESHSLIRSAPMEHSSEPNDSSFDEEFVVAPPFTAIGRSIPSMSWLNKQLEPDGHRPGMRGEEQNSKGEQLRLARDALSQPSPRSEAFFCTAYQEFEPQTTR